MKTSLRSDVIMDVTPRDCIWIVVWLSVCMVLLPSCQSENLTTITPTPTIMATPNPEESTPLPENITEIPLAPKFIQDVYTAMSSYEIQSNRSLYNVADLTDWGVENKPQGILITETNLLQFVEIIETLTNDTYTSTTNNSFVMNAAELQSLNTVLNQTLSSNTTVTCEKGVLAAEGGFVILSTLVATNPCDDTILAVDIRSDHKVFIDTDISYVTCEETKQNDSNNLILTTEIPKVSIIAPTWEVVGTRYFDLDSHLKVCNACEASPVESTDGTVAVEGIAPVGVAISDVTTTIGVATTDVTTTIGVSTTVVTTPIGVSTTVATTTIGVAPRDITIPVGVATSDVTTTMEVATSDVTTTIGVATSDDTAPISTTDATTPTGVDSTTGNTSSQDDNVSEASTTVSEEPTIIPGSNGEDGLSGHPGCSSFAKFLGIGNVIINGELLTISANGAEGNPGQNGGDGIAGKNGAFPVLNETYTTNSSYNPHYQNGSDILFRINYRYDHIHRIVNTETYPNSTFHYYMIHASEGDGGNGGDGGDGGSGGLPGALFMIHFSENKTLETDTGEGNTTSSPRLSQESGKPGEPGVGGKGAAGGTNVAQLLAVYVTSGPFNYNYSYTFNWRSIEKTVIAKALPGKKGKNGVVRMENVTVADDTTVFKDIVSNYILTLQDDLAKEIYQTPDQQEFFNAINESSIVSEMLGPYNNTVVSF